MSKLTSLKVINTSSGLCSADEIIKHVTSVYREGRLRHQLFNGMQKEPIIDREYKVNKGDCEKFFVFLDFVEDWDSDYSVEVCDGYYWVCYIRHSDKSVKVVRGTVEGPPQGEEIVEKIKSLVDFKDEPWIF